MTENKRYYRTNVNLEDSNNEPYYNIRDRKKEGNNILFMVNGKYTSKKIVELLNKQNERIRELLQDNDHKFWKLQFMHQFNGTSLIMHEISLAIKEGYEVSDKFKEYLDECKTQNEEGMKKANEQEKW